MRKISVPKKTKNAVFYNGFIDKIVTIRDEVDFSADISRYQFLTGMAEKVAELAMDGQHNKTKMTRIVEILNERGYEIEIDFSDYKEVKNS